MPSNIENRLIQIFPPGQYGDWEYRGGGPCGRGWVHKHWFKGHEGPANLYAVNKDGLCTQCKESIPKQLLTIINLQQLNGM
jgi:hypothetical protein